MLPSDIRRHAVYYNGDSATAKHRPLLTQTWDASLPRLGWGGLNPSTADEFRDDPTAVRIRSFTAAWGYGGFDLVNLYDYRATKRRELKTADRRSPLWDAWFYRVAEKLPFVMAWGRDGGADGRAVMQRLVSSEREHPLYVLVYNADGSPKHPLYVRGDTQPIPVEAP